MKGGNDTGGRRNKFFTGIKQLFGTTPKAIDYGACAECQYHGSSEQHIMSPHGTLHVYCHGCNRFIPARTDIESAQECEYCPEATVN